MIGAPAEEFKAVLLKGIFALNGDSGLVLITAAVNRRVARRVAVAVVGHGVGRDEGGNGIVNIHIDDARVGSQA